MTRIKFKELTLIILVAVSFFLLGNILRQFNFYSFLRSNLLSRLENRKSFIDSSLFIETSHDTDEISSLSLNNKVLIDTGKPLKFLVAGHIYGNPYENNTYHPATTLLTNLQLFNQLDFDMVVLLGDIVKESNEDHFDNFTNNFLDFLKVPVLNAVGDHDVGSRVLYLDKFGETTFSFVYKEYLFIFLDTNLRTFSLDEKQLNYIQETINSVSNKNKVKSIHIFAHHVFFFKTPFKPISNYYRTNESYSIDKLTRKFIRDTLIPISLRTPIFIYTGDVGAWCGNLSPYYKKFDGSNITAIATGIGNCEEDSVLIVEEINNEITLTVFSLLGKEMMPIEFYNDDYWKNK
jgi:hypothetical protein